MARRRYLFCSHDGFGLGHVRRNTLIASALLGIDPEAEIVIMTGVAVRPRWLRGRFMVQRVPPLLKGSDGSYRSTTMSFDGAIAQRAAAMRSMVDEWRPNVVVVDRHPYGIAGELRDSLERAHARGVRTVLGLRDVLDEPARIRAELNGRGWDAVDTTFDELLVYGEAHLCDHALEYGLPIEPAYCGWVVDSITAGRIDPNLIVVAAGGGGDGVDVYRLGTEMLRLLPARHGVIVSGPYAAPSSGAACRDDPSLAARIATIHGAASCANLFARAGAVVQMAGYNSTVEALAAGARPVLVPRRSPRREQAIRASRLAAVGLADVIDEGADAEEAVWLLDRPRRLEPGALAAAGMRLDGADRAAGHLVAIARQLA